MTASIARFKAEVLGGTPAVTRLAPSPTGRAHLGHALSGLVGMDLMARLGGRFLLRIEDTDPDRCREEFVAALLEDLSWAGLRWEEPVLRQSEHMPTYAAAAARLKEMDLLYPCFASRADIERAARPGDIDPDGAPVCRGLHRNLGADDVARRQAAGQPCAVRLDMAKAVEVAAALAGSEALAFKEMDDTLTVRQVPIDPLRWGDVVIQRKGTPTSYHLSVVVDDARQAVSIVTRGADLRPATDIHRLLQILLGLPSPIYFHHRLIYGADGRKLSKSDRSTSLAELREQGVTVQEVRRRLAPWLAAPALR